MEDRFIMFRNRLIKVFRHLGRQAKRSSVTCYRIYDHDLPEFPFSIEIYEKKLYVAEYLRSHGMSEEEHGAWLNSCLNVMEEVLSIRTNDIFLKLRKRKAGRKDQYRVQSIVGQSSVDQSQSQPQPQPQPFHLSPSEFIVNEGGLKFIVNFSDYLDTGLFLDHRITRQMIRERSGGKKILNLFCYTGSFSVYAADGGATEVVSIDMSGTYLDWARRNFELNGFNEPMKFKFIKADVLQWLQKIPENFFDLVILDPPTFSNSKSMKRVLDIQRDHPELINSCLAGLEKNGRIYFSTNYQQFELVKENIQASSVENITNATTPFDFKGKLKRKSFLILK